MGPNLVGGVSSLAGTRGTPCIHTCARGSGRGEDTYLLYFRELQPCCAPHTEVSSIMVVALFQPPKRGCFQPPRGGLQSSPSLWFDPPPSALDPSVNNAVGYTIVGYRMYARTQCARMQMRARASASLRVIPTQKLASGSGPEHAPES